MNSKTIHRPKVAKERGELKIFLGAVPGIGKTYRMLNEAKDRIARGEPFVAQPRFFGNVAGHQAARLTRTLSIR